MRRAIALLASLPIVAFACSDATDGKPRSGPFVDSTATGNDAGSANPTSGSSGNPGVKDSGGGGESDGPVAAPNGVVINEIAGKGANWVELYNGSSATVDLGGWALADSEKDGGAPKQDEATIFPAGTSLAPGAYGLVVKIPDDAGAGAAPECPSGGQVFCIGATWGISNKAGDAIYLLDKTSAIATEARYPANTVGSGQTWGRVPNATGDFGINLPTPGEANRPQ